MVRLVFRHYTHLLPSSCTSEPLRSSRKLSSSFNQNKYSSPSFGSDQYIYGPAMPDPLLRVHNASIISLVRVPRRVKLCFLPHPHFHFSPYAFSYFNHSTSSLSVIPQYLVLDRSYHPLSDCNPKQSYSSLSSTEPTGISPPVRHSFHSLSAPSSLSQLPSFNRITTQTSPLSLAVTPGILFSFFSSL